MLICCLRVLNGQRVPIISVIEWLKRCWIHVPTNVRFRKDIRGMLLINKTVTLIVSWDALGLFLGFGNAVPFSAGLSDFCRSFRVESNTTVKIYVSHDVFLIIEVHNFIETVFLEIWPQFDIKSAFCRKMEWIWSFVGSYGVLDFIVGVQQFMRKELFLNFGHVWALNLDRKQVLVKKFDKWLGTLVAEGSDLFLLRMISKKNFQISELVLLYNSSRIISTLYGHSLLFCQSYNDFHKWEVFHFLGTQCKFNNCFVFQSFFQSFFSIQPVALSRDFFPLRWVLQTRCLALLIRVTIFPRQFVNIRGEPDSLDFFFTDELFHPFNWFLNLYSRFLKW